MHKTLRTLSTFYNLNKMVDCYKLITDDYYKVNTVVRLHTSTDKNRFP